MHKAWIQVLRRQKQPNTQARPSLYTCKIQAFNKKLKQQSLKKIEKVWVNSAARFLHAFHFEYACKAAVSTVLKAGLMDCEKSSGQPKIQYANDVHFQVIRIGVEGWAWKSFNRIINDSGFEAFLLFPGLLNDLLGLPFQIISKFSPIRKCGIFHYFSSIWSTLIH
jgi:hypothetical protein